MEEELLKQFTTKLIHYVNSAEIFLKGNVPDYIEQLLKYEMYHQINILVVGLTLFAIITIIARMLHKNAASNKDDTDAHIIYVFFCGVSYFFWFTWFLSHGMNSVNTIVKINVAPKVYVIDYLRGNK